MDKATRIQKVFSTCYELHNTNLPITVDAIYKKCDSQIPKMTISDDLKFLKSFICPKGKRWEITQKGLNAAKNGDVFNF